MTHKKQPKKRRDSRSLDRELVNSLATSTLDPAELAQQFGMSLQDLAAWSSRPESMRALGNLIHLTDVRARILLSQHRTQAMLRLMEIATASEPSDLSRKACVDLLKAELKHFEMKVERVETSSLPEIVQQMPSEEAILKALEAMSHEP